MKTLAITTALAVSLAAICCIFPTPTYAAGEQKRMVERAPKVRALKRSGHVGESPTGLLAVRTPGNGAEAIVVAENTDRTAIYKQIAQSRGIADWTLVGKRRFQQLLEQGIAGDWFQKPNGSWYQK